MTSPWWAAFGPAETTAPCGDQQHRLRWEAGRLTAPDHPDAESELVLGALGGDEPDCIRLLRAWGEHSDDLGVLMLGPRFAADAVTVDPGDAALARLRPAGWVGYMPLTGRLGGPIPGMPLTWDSLWHRTLRSLAVNAGPLPRGSSSYGPGISVRRTRVAGQRFGHAARLVSAAGSRASRPLGPGMGREPDPESARRAELVTLLALGPAFQFRLCATVAAAWEQREPGTARPALTAALAGRLAPVIAAWQHVSADEVGVSLADGPRGLERDAGRWRAGMRWVAAVWGPGLAVAGDHLVMDVTRAAYPEAEVVAVTEPEGPPAPLTVRCENAAGSAQAPRWRIIRP
jgi:hypothetical protein